MPVKDLYSWVQALCVLCDSVVWTKSESAVEGYLNFVGTNSGALVCFIQAQVTDRKENELTYLM